MEWEILGDRIGGEGGEFTIPQAVRRQHVYALGRTGAGKTTLLARLALADIARGEGVLVLDPHGDLVEDIIDHCPAGHLGRVLYLDLTDREYPVPLNLFECRRGDDKDTVCSQVIGVFKRLYVDMWGPQLEDLLRNLTLAMLDHQLLGRAEMDDGRPIPMKHRYNATLKEAHDFLYNQNMRREYYPFLTNPIVHSFWTDQYDRIGTLQRGATVTTGQIKYAASTTNKIRRFLLNPLVFDITANNGVQNGINFRDIMEQKTVVLVNLSKGKLGEDNSSLLGSVILSQLAVAALSRADLPKEEREDATFHVIVDEFQSFATERFSLLLSEARKYAVTLVIAHQYRDRLDQDMKGATLNCGSLLCFRISGRDAVDIAREFDSTPIGQESQFEPEMDFVRGGWVRATNEYGDVRYELVPRQESFAEREREIANALTQLANFTAMARLADATHATLATRNLPPTTLLRAQRIAERRQNTRTTLAVPSDARPSKKHGAYAGALHRQQAYEAEIDEQPGT